MIESATITVLAISSAYFLGSWIAERRKVVDLQDQSDTLRKIGWSISDIAVEMRRANDAREQVSK